jgi:basic membrane protein A
MKKIIVAIIIAFSIVLIPSVCTSKENPSVAFVYVGPVGDGGWSYAHDLGRKELEKMGIETTYVESVPETDADRVIRNLARKGYDIIFTTSFGFMESTLKISKQFPDTIFMHCSGFKTTNNMGNYFARMYQARYLAGMVAGMTTKTNNIGMIGSHAIPEIIRHINAFTLGVKSVNSDANVQVLWVNSWFDPAKEGAAANALIDNGADVVSITTDSAAATQTAEKRGVYAIGNDSDMTLYGPKAHLTANIFNWGIYYKHVYKLVKEGKWKPGSEWWNISTGVVGLSPYGSMVPQNVKDVVNSKKEKIIDGTFNVFAGPISDQSGQIKVNQGEEVSDAKLLSMDYFVEGVVGSIPK